MGRIKHPDASRARAFDPWRSLGLLLCAVGLHRFPWWHWMGQRCARCGKRRPA